MFKNVETIIDAVNNKLLPMIEAGNTNWLKCWSVSQFKNIQGYKYTGFNVLWLALQPFKNPIYGTFIQWSNKGFKIKKGAVSTNLLLVSDAVKETTKEDGSKETKNYKFIKTFNVFNAEQVEGDIDSLNHLLELNPVSKVNALNSCNEYIKNTKAVINHGGNSAHYVPSKDFISIPDVKAFNDTDTSSATENYYSTLFHELAHWSGHSSRLNRTLSTKFASNEYAFEELIAELTSAYLCAQQGVSKSPRPDHANYLSNWAKCIRDNKTAILKASGIASNVLKYLNKLQGSQSDEFKKVA